MKSSITLKNNYEFRRMYSKGKSVVMPSVVVYCRKNRSDHNRLGITVSTKIGHAVVRNRVRRRFREIFRLHKDELSTGYDMIMVARFRAVGSDYQVIERDFLRAVKKLGLLKEETV